MDDQIAWVLAYLIVGMLSAIISIIVEVRSSSAPSFNGTMMVVLIWPVVVLMIALVAIDRGLRSDFANLSSQAERNRSKRRRKRGVR